MRTKSVSRIVWCLVLAGLTLGLAACGSKDNEPQGPGSPGNPEASQPADAAQAPAAQMKVNAARFLTREDAEAILGKPVNDPTVVGDGVITSNISYIASDFSGISLFVHASTTAQAFDQAQAASKSISDVDPVPVANLGEKAYWAGGKLNQLNVLKSEYWLIVTVPAAGDKSLEMAKQAAEKILPRVK